MPKKSRMNLILIASCLVFTLIILLTLEKTNPVSAVEILYPSTTKNLVDPIYTKMVSAGNYHTCALKGDGTVFCWGDNVYGQLSPNTFIFLPMVIKPMNISPTPTTTFTSTLIPTLTFTSTITSSPTFTTTITSSPTFTSTITSSSTFTQTSTITPSQTITPSKTQTYTPTIRVSITMTKTNTPTRTLTNTPTTIPNGGFELGHVNWIEYSSHGYGLISRSPGLLVMPHGGDWAVWMGGDNDETAQLTQEGIFLTGVRYLHYWYYIVSKDECGYDFARVKVNGIQEMLYELCTTSNTYGWVQANLDLNSYIGTTINLQFEVTTDTNDYSNFLLDDVSLSN